MFASNGEIHDMISALGPLNRKPFSGTSNMKQFIISIESIQPSRMINQKWKHKRHIERLYRAHSRMDSRFDIDRFTFINKLSLCRM